MARTKASPRLRWWTVMLIYPQCLTDDFGSDIFVEWARTPTPEEAVPLVQRKAARAQRDLSTESTVDAVEPVDFKMIAVWPGRTTLTLDAMSGI